MQMCKSVLAKKLLVQDREQMLKNTNNAQNPINSPNTHQKTQQEINCQQYTISNQDRQIRQVPGQPKNIINQQLHTNTYAKISLDSCHFLSRFVQNNLTTKLWVTSLWFV